MTITADQVLGLQGFERGIGARPADVTFGQAIGDNINYYLQPFAQELATGSRTFIGREFDPDFDWTQNIPERHTPYISSYALAADAEDQARITEYIDQRVRLRERMARTPIGYQIAGEFLNPVNYLGIAFGAPLMTGGRIALARTVARGSAAAAGTEGLINIGLEVLDPVQSTAETLLNTVSVGAFSGVFEAARTLPAIRRQAAATSLREQAAFTSRVSSRLESLDGVDASALTRITPREDREFGNVENVQETYDQYTSELRGLRAQLGTVAESSGEARLIQDRIDELEALRRPYSDEVLFRTLEEEGLDTADLFRYSAGGDTWLSRWVTNPYRRFMNSNFGSANNTVKSIMFDLASDGGVQLEFHRSGAARAPSVFQESTTDLGEYIRVNDELSRLWAEDTAAPEIGSSILANVDINTTNLARRAQGRSDSLEAWLSEVSRLRTMGEDMNPAQSRAAELLNRYFEGWEKKLIDTGQIRTRTTIARQMGNLRQEIEALEARMTQLEARGRRVDAEETTLARRRSLLAELEAEYAMPSVAKVEPFLPRYFNTSRIRQRRDEFAEILTRWFTENPEIWSYNKTTKAWERVRLSTEPDAVARRVDETINNILQEDPSRPIEQVYTGSGRGGHLGYRSLDIPNRLVWDFIEQNPIAAMRNYTARVAPQYHFQKKFGTDRKGVVERIQKELRSAGVKERDVQAAVRDFNHLYDRVVGRVIRDPESWDQRAAALLRDATSFTYLGGAGVAALGDAGRIVMESELGTLARGSQAFFDPAIRRMSVRETRLAGAAIELNLGSAGLRMVDDQNFNFLNNARMDRVRNAFHAFNLLGPVTVLMKNFAGSLGAHMLIEYSQKLARGTASDFEASYLARHGIDAEMAARIADAPWQTDKSSGLILANSDEWLRRPVLKDQDGNRIEVLESADEPVGRDVSGRYEPAYIDSDGVLHLDRAYIEDEFASAPWSRPDPLGRVGDARKLKDAKRFDERPWTEEPYNLPEDSITSEDQWLNFLALRRESLKLNETFLNRQNTLMSLGNDEIIAKIGRQFGVDRLITDPEIIKQVSVFREDGGGPLAYHQYSFVDSSGRDQLGTVYLDLEGISQYWRRMKRGLEDPKKSLAEINDLLILDEIDPVIYQHRRAIYENAELFNSERELVDFILIHELQHGPNRQKPGESLPEYESRIDDLALAFLRLRKQEQRASRDMANSYALQASRGNAMSEDAFSSPDEYASFLAIRADLARRKEYSFKELGLDGRTNIHRSLRNSILNSSARRELDFVERASSETVRAFRNALNTHVNNTVMSATPADKPIIMDGVVYIREEVGARFGLKPDPNTPGYARVENGLLALPLQFYSFTLANVNKTVGLMMQGAVRNRAIGVAAMIGMGWMISSIRTPDYVWNDMSPQDKLGRAIDMSGVAALYSDLFYTTLQTSLALGGPNITAGALQPRYPQDPSVVDAVTNVTGAASGWSADMVRAGITFARGEYGEGASDFIRNLPFSNLWFLRDDINQIGRYLSN